MSKTILTDRTTHPPRTGLLTVGYRKNNTRPENTSATDLNIRHTQDMPTFALLAPALLLTVHNAYEHWNLCVKDGQCCEAPRCKEKVSVHEQNHGALQIQVEILPLAQEIKLNTKLHLGRGEVVCTGNSNARDNTWTAEVSKGTTWCTLWCRFVIHLIVIETVGCSVKLLVSCTYP